MKILLIGEITELYRGPNLIKYLTDSRENGYIINWYSENYYKLNSKKIKILSNIISKVFGLFQLFIGIMFSDVIYILPMNNKRVFYPIAFSKLLKKVIISDFFISFYDTHVFDRKTVKDHSKKANKYKFLDSFMIRKSDYIVCLAKNDIEHIIQLLNIQLNENKVRIIPLGIEEKKVSTHVRQKKFIICWWGSYIPLHGLDRIILTAKILKESELDFKLYIFGKDTPKKEKYIKLIKELDLEDVIEVNNDFSFINGKLEDFLINNCDLALGIFGDSLKAKSVIPHKLIESIAMKIPVLTMDTYALEEFFDITKELFVCKNNPEEMAKTIQKFINMPSILIEEKVNRAYDKYKSLFTIDAYRRNIDNLLHEIQALYFKKK